MVSARLIRLASVKTAARHSPSGVSSSSHDSAARRPLAGLVGSQIRSRSTFADQDRYPSHHHVSGGGGGQGAASKNVGIEVFAHGALGKEVVLAAFLSNSVFLVMRIGAEGLRSWLLDWPVAGKIRGLCVSPDLQCILCVTDGLGVYLLAINNLGGQDEPQPHPTESVPNLDDSNKASSFSNSAALGRNKSSLDSAAGGSGRSVYDGKRDNGGNGGSPAAAAAGGAAAATARHALRRTVADTAFPSLLHLASRGEQRKRAVGEKPRHPSAEPVFIASLARRGGRGRGGEDKEGSDDGNRGGNVRRHSTGLGGQGPGRRSGYRSATAPSECLWWVTRDGDHFAVIGGSGGEVHFLDLERLDAWVVTQPPPAMARGRVCALSIVADLAGTTQQRPSPRAEGEAASPLPSEAVDEIASAAAEREQSSHHPPRHLVAVLETGAVFVVLLERSSTGGSPTSDGGEGDGDKVENEAQSEAKDENSEGEKRGGDNAGSSRRGSSEEYVRLGADRTDQLEFSPVWLDVGRGGGGGGGGGMGVRVIPRLDPPAGTVGRDASSRRLRMSIVSRAWGNKCAVKILRVAGTPGAAGGSAAGGKGKEQQRQQQQGWARERGRRSSSGKQQALRTETVRQVTLPVDHPVPEQHALAVVDESYAVLASPPAGGAPARVTVAPLGGSERPAAHPVCVFPLPVGEHVSGVALLPFTAEASGIADEDGKARGSASPSVSLGFVWSESCVYRIDLGVDAQAGVQRPVDVGRVAAAAPRQPPPQPTPSRHSVLAAGTAGSIALHRPSAASVHRARELHAAGQLSEAIQVAIEALDGSQSSSTTGPRGTGGGVTTRMVREELANSLLEWLVTLHVRRASANSRLTAAVDVPRRGGRKGVAGTGVDCGSGVRTPEDDKKSTAKMASVGLQGRSAAATAAVAATAAAAARQDFKSTSKDGLKTRQSVAVTDTKASLSQLEQYLLTSRDYDPVLAATLLHENGEDDFAVVAGSARGEKEGGRVAEAVLPKVLRVLSESAWPPRLGPRAVDAVCADGTGAAAAREFIRAGGGTLFAALEPCLQLRVLLSDRSIMFGGAEIEEEERAAAARAEAAVEEAAAEGPRPVASGAVAGVFTHIGPIVSALSVEELSRLVATLAQWCKDDIALVVLPAVATAAAAAAGRDPEKKTEGVSATTTTAAAGVRLGDDTNTSPSAATPAAAFLEAIEVLVQALCELGGRAPPPGERHWRAWSHAGCVINDTDTPAARQERGGEAGASVPRPRRLDFAQLTASLCGIILADGMKNIYSGDGDAGGLPAAARRHLLSVLPVVRGWHDPVRALFRLKEAGCWAAVALQLELSGNGREAASATLHGVVTLLQGEESAPGETARILNGNGIRPTQGSGGQDTPGSASPMTTTAEAEYRKRSTASEALLRTVDKYVFPRAGRRDGDGTTARTDGGSGAVEAEAEADGVAASSPPSASPSSSSSSAQPLTGARTSAPASATVILARASVLAEALCVWKYFGLPLTALEASLPPRLDEVESVRVLAAVFFPQLSRDSNARSGTAPSRDLPTLAGERGVGGGAGETNRNAAYLDDLGLSPRFFLALARAAAAKPSGLASTAAAAAAAVLRSPPSSHPPHRRLRSESNNSRSKCGFRPATTSGPSPLTLLLEHRAGGGAELAFASSLVRLAAPLLDAPASSIPTALGRRAGQQDTPTGAWPQGAEGYPPSSSTARAAATAAAAAAAGRSCAEDATVWSFSCGHRFSRDHLLNTVVPESASSVRQATASLERTQQVLTLEYEGRRSSSASTAGAGAAGAACPECAVKELVRLAAVAGASMQPRGTFTGPGNPVPIPPPPPPPRRLQAQGRPKVR